MLSSDDAWAIATAAPGARTLLQYLKLFGTRRNCIAPPCSWLELGLVGNFWAVDYQVVTELLQVWHALASCPGYSASENRSFWRRVLQKIHQRPTHHMERALFFPDGDCLAFPMLRLGIAEHEPDVDPFPDLAYPMQFLRKLFDLPEEALATNAPSSRLQTMLATLQPHIDMARFLRPIPVQLVYQVPNRGYRQRGIRDYSQYVARLHEVLVAIQTMPLQAESTAMIMAKPRYVLQSLRLVGIHNLNEGTWHELTSLMNDPRLQGLTFPRIGVAMLHRATHETLCDFLNYILRPPTGDLVPTPRLPRALTLKCSQSALNTGHLETFFRLLPFTQGIRALTLNGMGTNWQLWAWLGFALFHPNVAASSLRKLSFLRHSTCFEPRTLSLFIEAASLRMASADEFAYVVESYGEELAADGADSEQSSMLDMLATVLKDSRSYRPAPIISVAVDFRAHLHLLNCTVRACDERSFDMTAWTLLLAMLSPTLQNIYITPLTRLSTVGRVFIELNSAAAVQLVRQCPQLKSLSIPTQTWTNAALTELLDTTRGTLQSLQVHAMAPSIHRLLQALTQAARSDSQYALRHVSLVVHSGQLKRDGPSWRLCGELLLNASKPAFCLEYLFVHVERLDYRTHWLDYGDTIGETARSLKRFDGELLPHAQAARTSQQAVALLSVVVRRPDAACGRLDAVMVAAIVAFVRPRVRRHVGIEWFNSSSEYQGIRMLNDEADTFGTNPDRDVGRFIH